MAKSTIIIAILIVFIAVMGYIAMRNEKEARAKKEAELRSQKAEKEEAPE